MMHRVLKVAAINLGLVIAGLIVTELVFGTWFSRDPLDKVNILRGADVLVDARGLYPEGRVFRYRRNRWGFRGGDVDPATIDIVTIGGSTTNQLYLPEELTWQTALEQRLRELGRPAKIANAGFEGQSTHGMIYNFEAWFPFVPNFKPKYVIAYVGINDALVGYSTTDRLAFTNLRRWIHYNSAILRLWRTVRGMVLAHTERITHFPVDFARVPWTDEPRFPDNRSARPEHDAAAYAARVRELVRLIRGFGAEPVLVTQMRGDSRIVEGKRLGIATTEGMNGLDHRRLLEEFNAVTLSICADTRAICVDVANALDHEFGDFYDIVHTTPRGAKKVADAIARALVDRR